MVDRVMQEVDGDPVSLKRELLPFDEQENVLKAIGKREQQGDILLVRSSVRATSIMEATKHYVGQIAFLVDESCEDSLIVHRSPRIS